MLSAAPAADRQSHRAPLDGPPRVADAQFVQHVGRKGVLVVRRKRPRRRVLRTDGHVPAGMVPLPSGKGVTGTASAEVRQPSEHLIAVCRELVIDAHIALILVVDLVGRPAVVVRGGAVVGSG